MWKNNEYKISIREDSIYDYEKIVLTSGNCNYLLPMIFLGVGGKQVAYYKCNGFSPISEFKLDKTEDAIYILEKVLLIVSRVSDYLIMPSRLTITTDTVFYNENSGEIKIAYVPHSGDEVNIRRHILSFASDLMSDIRDGMSDYFVKGASLIGNMSYEIKDIVNELGLLRRKLYSQTNALS
ncbi:MAG: DUF6382 domain-containing protein [Firmicutes bacterium]|nr:DUF6382 domain-containing protein [Bacillota bacterium]